MQSCRVAEAARELRPLAVAAGCWSTLYGDRPLDALKTRFHYVLWRFFHSYHRLLVDSRGRTSVWLCTMRRHASRSRRLLIILIVSPGTRANPTIILVKWADYAPARAGWFCCALNRLGNHWRGIRIRIQLMNQRLQRRHPVEKLVDSDDDEGVACIRRLEPNLKYNH